MTEITATPVAMPTQTNTTPVTQEVVTTTPDINFSDLKLPSETTPVAPSAEGGDKPVVNEAPKKETPNAHRLAVEARKERERRAEAKRLADERAQFDQERSEAQAILDARAAYKKDPATFDPMKFIEATGLTPEAFIDSILNYGKQKNQPPKEPTVDEIVEAKLKAREDAARVAQEQKYVQDTLTNFRAAIEQEGRAQGDTYELLNSTPGAYDTVFEIIAQHHYATGQLLDKEKVKAEVEAELQNQAELQLQRLTALKKLQAKKPTTPNASNETQKVEHQETSAPVTQKVDTLVKSQRREVPRTNELLDKDELLKRMMAQLSS